MSRRGFSPLERRLLVALLSLIRETEPERDEWTITDIRLSRLYERCYRLDPDKSYELQRRNQRQSMRRALGRLHPTYVGVMALAWVNLEDEQVWRWQGGGSKLRRGKYAGQETPRWRMVSLNHEGIAAAELLEREQAGGGAS